jgi:tRNA nucleotidyltransferase/poly(A) polymerase
VNIESKEISQILHDAGYEAYIVGGAVRDHFLHRESKDIDIATNAVPDEIKRVFLAQGYHMYPVGEKFGTIAVRRNRTLPFIEITTYRSESEYTDNRHPDKIQWEEDITQDLKRRDITINAIALDIVTNTIVDPFHGILDIYSHTIQAVGNPVDRFKEDPLRMMRACRFAGELSFAFDPGTWNTIINLYTLIDKIPKERVRDELFRILEQDDPQYSLIYLLESSILSVILPEVHKLKLISQPPEYHKHDVFLHSIVTANALPKDKPMLRLAGLLHDIGKVNKRESSPFFPGHEKQALPMIDVIVDRLKLSNEQRDYLHVLIGYHMSTLNYENRVTDRAIRRFLSKFPDRTLLSDLFLLQKADIRATDKYSNMWTRLGVVREFENRVKKVIDDEPPFTRSDLAINGHDIMEMGVKPSAFLGRLLDTLLSEVIDKPSLNTREYLLKRVKVLIG